MLLSMENYTLCCRFGEEKAFEMMKKSGFDACDFSFYYEREKLLGDDYMKNAARTKAALERCGLLCNQAHAPFRMGEGEAFDVSNENYLHIVRAMEYAAFIGARYIVIHLIVTENRDSLYEYNLKYFSSFEPYCKKFGIKVAVENDFERRCGRILPMLENPEEYKSFIKDLDSDCFCGCVDIGHAALFNKPCEFIRQLDAEVLKVLHVHDNDLNDDKHMFPCTGEMDWNKICTALSEIGYDGDFTLEVIKMLDKFEDELIEDAILLLSKTGRHLINKIKASHINY